MERESKLVIALMIAVMMGAIDTTIVVLAFLPITKDLHTSFAYSIWVIMVYLLVLAVGTTQLGRLGDIFARKNIFVAGIAIFTIGSALCGASPGILYLIAFRIIQGSGAAMIQSNSGAIIAENFPPNRRGRIFGYTGVGYNAGAMLGIVLGGFITQFIGWQFIFYINVPIGAFALWFALRNIKKSEPVGNKLDIPGIVLLATGLALISYASVDLATYGLRMVNEVVLAAGAAVIIAMVFVERKVERPLLPLKVFKVRVLTFSIFASFFQSLGFLAVAFIVIMYLQGIRGLNPEGSSLLLLPGYVVGSVLGPLFGRLTDRIGSRIPATLGIGIMGISILIYLTLTVQSSFYVVIFASLVTGVGTSMFFPANNSAVMANSPRELYGMSSGFLRTMSSIGMLGSFVVAISVASINVPRYIAFEVFAGSLQGGVPSGFLIGIRAALLVSLVVLIVAGILSAFRGKEERSEIHVR
jgi:EmrB/QacA subfamily drug resistance transporter